MYTYNKILIFQLRGNNLSGTIRKIEELSFKCNKKIQSFISLVQTAKQCCKNLIYCIFNNTNMKFFNCNSFTIEIFF